MSESVDSILYGRTQPRAGQYDKLLEAVEARRQETRFGRLIDTPLVGIADEREKFLLVVDEYAEPTTSGCDGDRAFIAYTVMLGNDNEASEQLPIKTFWSGSDWVTDFGIGRVRCGGNSEPTFNGNVLQPLS